MAQPLPPRGRLRLPLSMASSVLPRIRAEKPELRAVCKEPGDLRLRSMAHDIHHIPVPVQ